MREPYFFAHNKQTGGALLGTARNVIYLLSVIVMIILIILIVHFIKNSNVDNLSIIFDEIERRF